RVSPSTPAYRKLSFEPWTFRPDLKTTSALIRVTRSISPQTESGMTAFVWRLSARRWRWHFQPDREKGVGRRMGKIKPGQTVEKLRPETHNGCFPQTKDGGCPKKRSNQFWTSRSDPSNAAEIGSEVCR